MTPERRLPKILKEGLKGSTRKVLGTEKENTRGKIFLGEDPEDCRLQLDISGPYSGIVHNWGILEIDLPKDYPLKEDDFGFIYTTRNIPPECLRVWSRDSQWKRELLKRLKE